jgi:hypothetical protein
VIYICHAASSLLYFDVQFHFYRRAARQFRHSQRDTRMPTSFAKHFFQQERRAIDLCWLLTQSTHKKRMLGTMNGVGFNDARHVVCMLANVADAFEKPHQVFQTLGAMHNTLLA